MPGTPPCDAAAERAWAAQAAAEQQQQNSAKPPVAARARARRKSAPPAVAPPGGFYAHESAESMAARHTAARSLQRAASCFLARRSFARHVSAVGRPVELRVAQVQNLELLCDFRDVASVYCNVRVLKRPFGPFMFQFSTTKCTNVHLPTWQRTPDDAFFVPMLSSRCDLVVTLIGVTVTHKQRFLGQAVAQLEPGWETRAEVTAPLGKWKFPVEASLLGLHRFVIGDVHLELTPVSSRLPCKAGQFLMAPPVVSSSGTTSGGLLAFWTRRVTTPLSTPSPQTPNNPASASPARKSVVTRWGVLTDTSFHLFDHSSAKLLVSLDLAKLQLIASSGSGGDNARKRDPSRLYPLKLYAHGTLYTLYVSTFAQQQAWEHKINAHRRQLLIP